MVETRAQDLPGPDGILGTADDVHSYTNQTRRSSTRARPRRRTRRIDVFLRAYMIGADGKLHSTGALLGHARHGSYGGVHSMATWGDLKASAAQFLGIKLTDYDVGNVPLLATDAYGNFIPGAHGLPQLVVTWTSGPNAGKQGLVEGNLAKPVGLGFRAMRASIRRPAGQHRHRRRHAFIDDMAHDRQPVRHRTATPLPRHRHRVG